MPGSKDLAFETTGVVQFSATEMLVEAQRESAFAEAQLQADLSQIKSVNDERRHFNELVISVASYATGKSLGEDAESWQKAVVGQLSNPSESVKPTLTELVPLEYQPTFAQVGFMNRIVYDT